MHHFQAEGVEVVVCVTVNDPFVAHAWSKEIDSEGKVGEPRY